jgi:cytochrome c nitrite reductase small subunit
MKMHLLSALTVSSFGVLLGIGGVAFDYAEGLSYLSTEPAACTNCHIMLPQYEGWLKASHHTVATCADCHLPAHFPDRYLVKAANGWSHSKAFTLQDFSEPIFIAPGNAETLHANCLRCHGELVHGQSISYVSGAPRCVRCHVDAGHGEPVGLGGPLRHKHETELED